MGGYNKLVLLTYPDNFQLIARLPLSSGYQHVEARIASAAAAMTYARLHHRMPVPAVYAWNNSLDRNNEVGSPYMLLEYMPGDDVDLPYIKALDGHTFPGWQPAKAAAELKPGQYTILDNIARRQVQDLLRPLPFKKYGNIYFAADSMESVARNPMDPAHFDIGPINTLFYGINVSERL